MNEIRFRRLPDGQKASIVEPLMQKGVKPKPNPIFFSSLKPITTNLRDGEPFLGYDNKTYSKKFLCYYDQEHGVFYNEYDCEMNPTHWEKAPCKS